MDNYKLGQRLKSARELSNISQEVAAEMLGVPRTAFTHIEQGNRNVSTFELSKLADLYKRPITYFFQETDEESLDSPLVSLFRLDARLENDERMRSAVERYASLCQAGRSLESALDIDQAIIAPTYDLPMPRSTMDAVDQGERVADAERSRLQIGNGPLKDIIQVISSQGIWVCDSELADGISGLFLKHPSLGIAILVNNAHSRGRKRFSYAHEYGHALMDRKLGVNISASNNIADRVEQRANAFAASLLMPEEGVKELLKKIKKGQPSRIEQTIFEPATDESFVAHGRSETDSGSVDYQDVALINRHFDVSYRACVYRLKSLKIINQTSMKELLESESLGLTYSRLFKEKENENANEMRDKILYLMIEGYRREVISRGRVLELSKKLDIAGSTVIEYVSQSASL